MAVSVTARRPDSRGDTFPQARKDPGGRRTGPSGGETSPGTANGRRDRREGRKGGGPGGRIPNREGRKRGPRRWQEPEGLRSTLTPPVEGRSCRLHRTRGFRPARYRKGGEWLPNRLREEEGQAPFPGMDGLKPHGPPQAPQPFRTSLDHTTTHHFTLTESPYATPPLQQPYHSTTPDNTPCTTPTQASSRKSQKTRRKMHPPENAVPARTRAPLYSRNTDVRSSF